MSGKNGESVQPRTTCPPGFRQLPNSIWQRRDLIGSDLKILCALMSYPSATELRRVWVGNKALAGMAGVSVRTVQMRLDNLEALGLIRRTTATREEAGRTHRLIELLFLGAPSQNSGPGTSQDARQRSATDCATRGATGCGRVIWREGEPHTTSGHGRPRGAGVPSGDSATFSLPPRKRDRRHKATDAELRAVGDSLEAARTAATWPAVREALERLAAAIADATGAPGAGGPFLPILERIYKVAADLVAWDARGAFPAEASMMNVFTAVLTVTTKAADGELRDVFAYMRTCLVNTQEHAETIRHRVAEYRARKAATS